MKWNEMKIEDKSYEVRIRELNESNSISIT